ncbi:MAG: hypothetical protein NT157_06620, partial [Candidatus Micrarchaeota archaeon]|nr:hypothetical protein [Candidatus Micrarchaeota archaeon]
MWGFFVILQAAAEASKALPAIPVFDPVFLSLAARFGPYYALALVLIAIAVAFDVARYVMSVMTHLLERHEGTGILDTFYYAAEHGEIDVSSFTMGVVSCAVGIFAIRTSPDPAKVGGVLALVTAEPVKAVGALFLIVGLWFVYRFLKNAAKRLLFGAWYREQPEVKKMKTEIVTSFKKSKTLDVIQMFRGEISMLLGQFREADYMKFTFQAEEAEITAILDEFRKAEELSEAGNVKEADKRITKAKKRLDAMKPKIEDKLKRFRMARETIQQLNSVSKAISEMHGECERLGVDVSGEKTAFSKLDVNKSLVVAENMWNRGDFAKSLGELTRLGEAFEKIRTDSSEKLSRQKALIARKFHCVRCGGMLDLAHTKCPDCGETADMILEEMKGLIDGMETLSERFDETKWLISFEEEQKSIAKLSSTINEIAGQVGERELDRAVSLLASVN